jgi:hypothetical protein
VQVNPDQDSGSALYLVVGFKQGGFHDGRTQLPSILRVTLPTTEQYVASLWQEFDPMPSPVTRGLFASTAAPSAVEVESELDAVLVATQALRRSMHD